MANEATIGIGIGVADPDQILEQVRNILNGVSASASSEGEKISGTLTEQATNAAKSMSKGVEKETKGLVEKVKESFKDIGSTITKSLSGALAIGGAVGIGEGFAKLFEAGEKGRAVMEQMGQGFGAAGLKGEALEKAVKQASAAAVDMGAKFGIPADRLKEISADAALFGGATGKMNQDVTLLAGGIEKMSNGTLSATQVIKAFTGGINDPEAQANLGRLKTQFPQLATALKGITDPSQMAKTALKALGGGFDALAESAQSPLGKLEVFKDKVLQGAEVIGGVLVDAIGTLAGIIMPVFTFIGDHIEVFGALTAIIGAFTIALNASSIAAGIKAAMDVIVTGTTSVWTVAQTALNVVLNANPISLVVLAIAALVAGIILAYKHSETFRNILDKIWEGIKKVAEVVWQAIKFWAEWLNPIGLAIKAFQYLYEKVGFVKTAIDGLVSAAKAVGGFFSNLWGAIAGGSDKAADSTEQTTEKIETMADKIKEAQDAVNKLATAFDTAKDAADKLTKEDVSGLASVEQQINAITQQLKNNHSINKDGRIELEAQLDALKKQKAEIIANSQAAVQGSLQMKAAEKEAQKDLGLDSDKKKKTKENNDTTLKSIDDFLAKQQAATLTARQKALADSAQSFKQEQDKLDEALKKKKIGIFEYEAEKQKLTDAGEKARIAINKKYDAEDQKTLHEHQKRDKEIIDKMHDARFKELDDEAKAKLSLMEDGTEKEVAQEDLRYVEEREKYKGNLVMQQLIFQQHQDNLNKIALKGLQQRLDQERKSMKPLEDGMNAAFGVVNQKLFQPLAKKWDEQNNALGAFGVGVVKAFVTMGEQKIAQLAIDATVSAFQTATAAATGTAMASAYATPAALASIMSFGGADVAGATGLATTIAAAQGLAIIPHAEGGVFDKPIFGVSGGRVHMAGEVPEVVAPISTLSKTMGVNSLAEKFDALSGAIQRQQFNTNITPKSDFTIKESLTGTALDATIRSSYYKSTKIYRI